MFPNLAKFTPMDISRVIFRDIGFPKDYLQLDGQTNMFD